MNTNLENLKEQVRIGDYLSIGIGGPAKFFFEARSRQDLIDAIAFARGRHIPFSIIGGGSNTIASDDGFDGLVILNRANKISYDGTVIEVETGYVLLKMIMDAAKQDLGGLHPLAGVPGTVGGAIRGNSGAYGGETKDYLLEVEVLKEDGEVAWMTPKDLEMSYRHSLIKVRKDWVALRARFQFKQQKFSAANNEIRSILNKRNEAFPKGRSAGCFFKNPTENSSAGMLIDNCGLKDYMVGGVKVSPKHANYLINDQEGSCKDAMRMVAVIKEEVKEKFKFDLELEVNVLGKLPEVKEEEVPRRTVSA